MTAPNADLVSVIIPTYNRARLLLEALASVRRQTWPHIQIIVADDGSTDNTADLVAGMPDVCYVRQEHAGQGAARNLGLRYAEGAFISSLDSDDLWEPDFLESSIHALRVLQTDFVFSNWTSQTLNGERYPSQFEEEHGWSAYRETVLEGWRILEPSQARAIYMDACVSPSSSLVLPREALAHGWSEKPKIADDWCLLLDLVLSRPCRVAVSTQPRWLKRVIGDNICDGRDVMEVTHDLCVHDYSTFLAEFDSLMDAPERASLYARIGSHQAVLAKRELAGRHFVSLLKLLLSAVFSMGRAVAIWPKVIFWFARKAVSRSRRHRAKRKRGHVAQCHHRDLEHVR